MVRMVPTGVEEMGRWGEKENVVDIRLYGYNICNRMYVGIESALRVIVQANMDLGVHKDHGRHLHMPLIGLQRDCVGGYQKAPGGG